MARAVLPNPSARTEWLFASIMDRALHHWGHVLPLDGGPGDQNHADSETDTAIPDVDDDMASLSSPPSASLQPSSLQSRAPALAGQLASALLMFPGDLHLDALFEDHGMSWLVIEDVFALEWATYRRCFPPQPPLAARQRLNRQKCANLIQDLVDDAALPPQSAHFSLQLLDLAHRGSERQENNNHIFDVLSLATTVYILSKTNPAPAQGPQHGRPLADLLATIARLLARRQPHSAPALNTWWTIQQIVSEEYHILEVLKYELATPPPVARIEVFKHTLSLWRQQQLQQSRPPAPFAGTSQLARSRCTNYCGSVRSGPSLYRELQTQSSWGHRLGSSLAHSGYVSN